MSEAAQNALAAYAAIATVAALVLLILWLTEREWCKYHRETEEKYFKKYLAERQRTLDIE